MTKLQRNRIEKVYLKDLYIKQKLNLKEIGKIVGFSSRTIQILAKEYKIPLRPPGIIGPNITTGNLRKLYITKGLSSRKIAKIYKCAYSYIDNKIRKFGFPIRTLSRAHITTKRLNFSNNLKEKAYLIGFRIGDLRVRKKYINSETILIDCGSTKLNQILLIKSLFGKYGRVWISNTREKAKIQIEIGVNSSFSFLLRKYTIFPAWTTKNRKLFFSILAGFIDAEGSFYISKDNKVSGFSLGNYNKNILVQISDYLMKMNFSTRLFMGVKKGYQGKDGYRHRQDYWILSINRKVDLLNFSKLIMPYLKHKDRLKDAKKVLNNIKIRNEKFGFKGIGMLNFSHAQ